MWFLFAVSAACCFGLRGILYHWTSQKTIDRNLLLLGVYLSGAIISLGVNLVIQESWSKGAWIGVLMGLCSFVANASMYKGYAVGKASIVALFTGLPPLVVMIVAFFLWQEGLSAWQFTAFFIVLSGLILIKYSQELKLSQLHGIQWGILTMLFFGFTDVLIKQATLLGASTMPVLTVMFTTGSILFSSAWLLNQRKESKQEEHSWPVKRTIGWGMIVGITNVTGMILVFPAFRDGITGIVSAIIAMNVALVLLYARFYLKENWNKREVTGLIMAFIGIIILRVAS